MNYVKSHVTRFTVIVIMGIIALILGVWIYSANQHPSQGMVYGKHYSPASSYVTMQCSMYNNKGICVVYMPITHHIPECYELTLKAEGDKWGVCVDQHTYETIPFESTYKVAS